jgi:hypothetical protein
MSKQALADWIELYRKSYIEKALAMTESISFGVIWYDRYVRVRVPNLDY